MGVEPGRVLRSADDGLIAEIDRNFDRFPFSWCESHVNGHAYLVAGEDYQGQTIIELDTGARIDHIPDEAEQGHGFCWAAHYPSPDGRYLFVDGCYWAAPYELILFDFSEPLSLPYRELARWPVWEVHGFQADGSFVFDFDQDVRIADDTPVEALSDEEQDALEQATQTLVRSRTVRVTWRPDGEESMIALD